VNTHDYPFVSVIVPVKNDDGSLGALLQSLAHQSYPTSRFEVIVVHNDGFILEPPGFQGLSITSFSEAQGGSYAARNRGIEHAGGDILAFTDADCVAHPDWLAAGVRAVHSHPQALIAGHIQVFASSSEPSLAEKHQLAFAFDQEVNLRRRRGVPTANLIVSAEVVHHVGWFNPLMHSGGDAEWSKRALRYGYRWRLQKDAVVFHPARATFSALRAQRVRFATAIQAQPSGLRRLDWFLGWVSPRQGLMSRLRERQGLRKRDWVPLISAQLALAIFQVGVGLANLFGPFHAAPSGEDDPALAGDLVMEVQEA
jgi:glycosyltransferase involved in cell wall biosynthesis